MNNKYWQYVKIGEICEIILGQSPDSSSYNTLKDGLPFFQGKAELGSGSTFSAINPQSEISQSLYLHLTNKS